MIKNRLITLATLLLFVTLFFSCKKDTPKTDKKVATTSTEEQTPFFKLSLAQWSLHKAIKDDKTLKPIDFAQKAKELGFEGIEYVSQLYNEELKTMGMEALQDSLKAKSKKYDINNVLIMVDGEGDLASPVEKTRTEAVQNHKKWVDAAAFLGCHSIRVNLFGTNVESEWKESATKGLSALATYSKTKNINVIVENHGGFSSNGQLLTQVIKNVNMDNCGTLPDFGNFCIKRDNGQPWGGNCIDEYDYYKGVTELMPLAKAVSAKSYDFDTDGNETKLDYSRLLQIVKDAGYTGFIGVEYEGDRLGEVEGIEATKQLLIESAKKLN